MQQAGTTIAAYLYNALGQRVKKHGSATGGPRFFVYDEAGRLLGEYTGRGELVMEFVWLDDLPVALLKPKANGGAGEVALRYIHADHLGTPRRVTNPTNNKVIWRWEGAPFGETAPGEDPDGGGNVFRFNLRFPGQYYDRETGRHYNYFRDYDPRTGRYVQSDPIGLEGGINTYSYVGGNPVNATDPMGLMSTGRPPIDGRNGNTEPGFKKQDGICTAPADGLNNNKCTKQCCVEHDACYTRHRCNESSWKGYPGSPCQVCNLKAIACVLKAATADCCGD